MSSPRILIAGTKSGGGKTTVTCGLIKAFLNKGLKIGAFKVGPDYIDPMFHKANGVKVVGNIDLVFQNESEAITLFKDRSKDCDLTIIEGVMGYYDGLGGTTTLASAYNVSKITNTPTILVIDCKGKSLSILAEIYGFLHFKNDFNIVGVILNKISPMIYEKIKKEIESQLKIKVFGYFPNNDSFNIKSRHLGLCQPNEIQSINEKLNLLGNQCEETIDLDLIIKESKKALDLDGYNEKIYPKDYSSYNLKLGVAKDKAFTFIYDENIEFLKKAGIEIHFFSPLESKSLPMDIDGLMFFGGYPELFAKELESNISLKKDILKAFRNKMPFYAECGGYMYLQKYLENNNKDLCEMVGIFNGTATNNNRLTNFGYKKLKTLKPLFNKEFTNILSHEFHYYKIENDGKDLLASHPLTNKSLVEGNIGNTYYGGFPHIYFYGNKDLIEAYIFELIKYKKEKNND